MKYIYTSILCFQFQITGYKSNIIVTLLEKSYLALELYILVTTNSIVALELMGPRYRTFAGMVICMFFALGLSLLALLGYLLRNWYSLSLATSVPFVLLFR
jgi:hypothetical protein